MGVPAAVSACFTVSPKVTVSSPTVDTDELLLSDGDTAAVVLVDSPAAGSMVVAGVSAVVDVVDPPAG